MTVNLSNVFPVFIDILFSRFKGSGEACKHATHGGLSFGARSGRGKHYGKGENYDNLMTSFSNTFLYSKSCFAQKYVWSASVVTILRAGFL